MTDSKASSPAELKAHEYALFNILEQERLKEQLKAAVLWEGLVVIAERLGLEVIELESRLDEFDFTMTELRLLAAACEIRLSYNINLGSSFR